MLCAYTRLRYQMRVYRTIGPLVEIVQYLQFLVHIRPNTLLPPFIMIGVVCAKKLQNKGKHMVGGTVFYKHRF